VTATDIIRETVNSTNDGDDWACVMGALFDISATLYRHGDGPPDSWQYRPSPLLGDTPNPDEEYLAVEFENMIGAGEITTRDLLTVGMELQETRDTLTEQGRDY
jgi:hypothetical protein